MANGILQVKDNTVVDGNGNQVVLRGAAIGGWMKYAGFPSHFLDKLPY
jgi:hypothetical protein